jgi:hypothetical protein
MEGGRDSGRDDGLYNDIFTVMESSVEAEMTTSMNM